MSLEIQKHSALLCHIITYKLPATENQPLSSGQWQA